MLWVALRIEECGFGLGGNVEEALEKALLHQKLKS
jgi:hypothetical protein